MAEGVAADAAVEAEQRRGEQLLLKVAETAVVQRGRVRQARHIAAAAPAPARVGVAGVAPRDVDPGEGPFAGIAVERQRGVGVSHDGGQRVASAVREAELERAGAGEGQHMAELVPSPALVGGQAERLRAQALDVVGPQPAVRQVGPAESHLELRPLVARARPGPSLEQRKPVPGGAHLGVDSLAVARAADRRAMAQDQRQLRELEVLARIEAVGEQTFEQLEAAHVRLYRREVVRSQVECADRNTVHLVGIGPLVADTRLAHLHEIVHLERDPAGQAVGIGLPRRQAPGGVTVRIEEVGRAGGATPGQLHGVAAGGWLALEHGGVAHALELHKVTEGPVGAMLFKKLEAKGITLTVPYRKDPALNNIGTAFITAMCLCT